MVIAMATISVNLSDSPIFFSQVMRVKCGRAGELCETIGVEGFVGGKALSWLPARWVMSDPFPVL